MKTDNREFNITRRTHTFIYEITARNTGQADIQDLKITDEVPSHFTIIRITSGGHVSGQTVTWSNVELKEGEIKTFKIEVGVNPNAPLKEICNEAVAESSEHNLREESRSCITVKKPPQVAAIIAPVPVQPLGVPITAPTGPEAAGLLITLMGGSSLALIMKKFW